MYLKKGWPLLVFGSICSGIVTLGLVASFVVVPLQETIEVQCQTIDILEDLNRHHNQTINELEHRIEELINNPVVIEMEVPVEVVKVVYQRVEVPVTEVIVIEIAIETEFFPDEATMKAWLDEQPITIFSAEQTCVRSSFNMQRDAAMDGWWMQVYYHSKDGRPHLAIETIAGKYMYRIEPQTHEYRMAYRMFE